MTAPVLRLRRARLAACTAALFSALRRTGGAAAETPRTRPCTACASGPVCGAQRVCSTTACRTLRESSGSLAPVMTRWGATHTPSAVPAGWPSWPCRSSCPACAATCLCAPACAVERGVAAVGESTRRSDEARLGDRRASLDRGSLGVGRRERERERAPAVMLEFSRWERWSQTTQYSDAALQSPKAFHCIPLFFTFQFGAFLTGPRLLKVHCTQTRLCGSHQEPS